MKDIFTFGNKSTYEDDTFLIICEEDIQTSIRKDEIVSMVWNFKKSKLVIKTKNDTFEFNLRGNHLWEYIGEDYDDFSSLTSLNIPYSYNFINITDDKVSIWRFATEEDYENGYPGGLGEVGLNLVK